MCRLEERRCESTSTYGGKLTAWWDEEEEKEEDEMYVYEELTQITLARKKRIELDASGDKNWKLPMRKSLFAHVPPYVIFHLYSTKNWSPLPAQIMKHLSWRHGARMVPQMVRRTVAKSGFKLARKSDDWSGNWGPPMASVRMKGLKLFQKVNHIPGIQNLSHKDLLWKNVSEMMERFGKSEFGFTPTTYVFPEDERRFQKVFGRHGGVWIAKPTTGCGGNGIRVFSKWCEIPKTHPLVVQSYITKPRLIRGVKFDMRLYALMTSADPLRIYLYGEGLVRFATTKYAKDAHYLFDRYMHLTNTSVNKTSPMFRPNDSLDKCKGNMWSLNSLWSYLAGKQRADISQVWEKIKDIVVKTVVSAEARIVDISDSNLPSKYNAYQLLGFDIILDENLTPWLLEVNNHPSMDPDTPLCAIVKGQLARDFLNIVGFQIPNTMSREDAKCLMEKYGQFPLCQDHRLHTRTLTEVEKAKQDKFAEVKAREDYLNSILEILTPDDVRHLILYEDEVTQIGGFEKIFPTKNTHKYHRFFTKFRYYNKLFDAWEDMYGSDKSRGILRLQKLCKEKYHLTETTLIPKIDEPS